MGNFGILDIFGSADGVKPFRDDAQSDAERVGRDHGHEPMTEGVKKKEFNYFEHKKGGYVSWSTTREGDVAGSPCTPCSAEIEVNAIVFARMPCRSSEEIP